MESESFKRYWEEREAPKRKYLALFDKLTENQKARVKKEVLSHCCYRKYTDINIHNEILFGHYELIGGYIHSIRRNDNNKGE